MTLGRIHDKEVCGILAPEFNDVRLVMLAQILKDSLSFYWKHLSYFIAILLPLIVPLEIFNAVVQLTWVTDPTSLAQQLPYFMATLIVYPIYQGALVVGVQQLLQGNKPRVKDLWSRGGSFWFAIVMVNVIYYIAVFLGSMLFFIPGIFLAIRLILAEQNAILNLEGPIDAIKSSWEDTQGQFWMIFFGAGALGLGTIALSWPFYELVSNMTNDSPVALIIPSVFQTLLYPVLVVFFLRVRHYIQHNE